MQQIDQLGAFESEDESGTTFQLLKEVITELKEQFDIILYFQPITENSKKISSRCQYLKCLKKSLKS